MGSGFSVFSRGTKVSDVAEEHAARAQDHMDLKKKYPNSPIHALTEAQIDEFRAAFNSFDSDGGGSIDSSELESVLKSLGQEATQDELDKLIAVADTDGSGDIDFLEFVVLIAHKMKKDTGTDAGAIKTAFSFFDDDNSGASNNQGLKLLTPPHRAPHAIPRLITSRPWPRYSHRHVRRICTDYSRTVRARVWREVDAHEMRRMMINLGEPISLTEVNEVLGSFDKDGDGQIDIDEFTEAICKEAALGSVAAATDAAKQPDLVVETITNSS